MKKNVKVVLMAAAAALGTAGSAQAVYHQGDLLVGFDGASSDFIYDLGAFSSLTPGETWNVGMNLGTHFGVVGASTVAAGSHIYSTSPFNDQNSYSQQDNYGLAKGDIQTIASSVSAMGQSRTTTPSDPSGWTVETDQPAGTPGSTFQNDFFNPNTGAATTAYLFVNSPEETAGVLSGSFKYVAATGILTFTPASSAPPVPTLSITRAGGTNTISFVATNSATYSLIFTNLPGLNAPRSNWFTLGSSITGVSGQTSFTDTNVTPGRVYSVTAH